ncbi:hypothetical protein [Sphaerisporangium sp. NPDC051011]|uniref:hypothetical protein n=1 Tax=Sphaerisporangium sp. NPDC051011 TaxID=3155792 RepID=UPI0033DC76B8
MIIAVIVGLVAVVLLVLMVVAIGMRSMNRRESNLPPERLRKMAEQAEDPNAKRPGRPAEETFFESFPEGFDAFQEPERATARLRPGNGKPGTRPAGRPGGRSAPRGKQNASSRGRRGVDEWGDADDYDDDYWTRVRADDGAFGGTIAARMGASRPDLASPSSTSPAAKAAPAKDAAKSGDEVDANAATIQAPLPPRPAGLAGQGDARRTTTPASPAPAASAAASERTATFPAPVPQAPAAAASAADVLGALGTPQPPAAQPSAAAQPPARTGRGSRPDPADPLGVNDAVRPKPRRRGESGDSGRTPAPGRTPDSRRTDSRRTGSGRAAEPGRSGSSRPESGRPAAGRPDAGNPLTTGPMSSGQFGAGALGNDPLTSGPLPGSPASGGSGSRRQPSGSSSDGARRRSGTGGSGGFDPGRSSTGSYDTPRPASADPAGPFPASPSYSGQADPLSTGTAAPAGGSWPSQPAYQATGSYDILDGPATPAAGIPAAPSSSSNEKWSTADYQLPSYDGYAARGETYTPDPAYPAATPSAPTAPSYEVRPGWATIDDSDTATGPAPSRAASAYETPAARDLPGGGRGDERPSGGQGYGGYGAGSSTGSAAVSSSWAPPRENTGGSWPSYGELYGNGEEQPTQSKASPSQGGHHRPADTDYPDYYR